MDNFYIINDFKKEAENFLELFKETEEIVVLFLGYGKREILYDKLKINQMSNVLNVGKGEYIGIIDFDKIKKERKIIVEDGIEMQKILLKLIFILEPENNYFIYKDFLAEELLSKLKIYIKISKELAGDEKKALFSFFKENNYIRDLFKRLEFVYTPLSRITKEKIKEVLKTDVNIHEIMNFDDFMKQYPNISKSLKTLLILKNNLLKYCIIEKIYNYSIINGKDKNKYFLDFFITSKNIKEIDPNKVSNDFFDFSIKNARNNLFNEIKYFYFKMLRIEGQKDIYESKKIIEQSYQEVKKFFFFLDKSIEDFNKCFYKFSCINFMRLGLFYKWCLLSEINKMKKSKIFENVISHLHPHYVRGERDISLEDLSKIYNKLYNRQKELNIKNFRNILSKNCKNKKQEREIILELKKMELHSLNEDGKMYFEEFIEKEELNKLSELEKDNKEKILDKIFNEKNEDIINSFSPRNTYETENKQREEIEKLKIKLANKENEILNRTISKLKENKYSINSFNHLPKLRNILEIFIFNIQELNMYYLLKDYYNNLFLVYYNYMKATDGVEKIIMNINTYLRKIRLTKYPTLKDKVISKYIEGYSYFEEKIINLQGRDGESFVVKIKNGDEYLIKYIGEIEEQKHIFEGIRFNEGEKGYLKVVKQEEIENGKIEIYEVKSLTFYKKNKKKLYKEEKSQIVREAF